MLRGDAEPGLLDRVDVLQPACFAVMVSLAEVWRSCGLRPDAVVGHSQGEIAAACVAGALSLEDAARVVALRSQAIAEALSGRGGMASVALGEDETAERLAPWAGLEVAAVNGPASVVIAGEAEALGEAAAALEGDGVRVRRVAVDYGSHTGQVEDIGDRLAGALAGVRAPAPVIPFYSTVTGERVRDAGVVDGGYWYRNLRSQVRFGPAVADLIARGHGVFVEVSAHPVLVQPVTEVADDAGAEVVVSGTLRRDDGGPRRLLTSMAALFVRGVPVDWTSVLPAGAGSARVDLPTYAFDHRHYWLQPAPAADAASLGQSAPDHPLLGAMVRLPRSDGLVFTSRLSLRSHPWLADHAVGGVVLFPGTGLAELAVRAGDEAGCPVLDELVTESPLAVPSRGGVRVQVAVGGPDENGARTVEVYSLPDDGGTDSADAWTRHAMGVLSAARVPATGFDFTAWPPPDAQRVEVGDFYAQLAERGYAYGPAFQGVRTVWRRGEEVFAEVALPDEHREAAAAYGIHPALLDAALQTGTVAAARAVPDAGPGDGQPGRSVMPFAWNGLVLHAAGAPALRVRISPDGPDAMTVEAADTAGGLVLTMDSLVLREVAAEQLDPAPASSLFGVDWTELAPVAGEPPPSWVPVAAAGDVTALTGVPAAAVLEAAGGSALALTSRVLLVVQAWLAATALEESRLVVTTRGAMPAGDGVVTDPAGCGRLGPRARRSEREPGPDRPA